MRRQIFSGGTHFHFYYIDAHNEFFKDGNNDLRSEVLNDTQDKQEVNKEYHQ